MSGCSRTFLAGVRFSSPPFSCCFLRRVHRPTLKRWHKAPIIRRRDSIHSADMAEVQKQDSRVKRHEDIYRTERQQTPKNDVLIYAHGFFFFFPNKAFGLESMHVIMKHYWVHSCIARVYRGEVMHTTDPCLVYRMHVPPFWHMFFKPSHIISKMCVALLKRQLTGKHWNSVALMLGGWRLRGFHITLVGVRILTGSHELVVRAT